MSKPDPNDLTRVYHVGRNADDEITYATIWATFASEERMAHYDTFTGVELRGALTAAIAHWVETTEEGRQFREQASIYINLGDLDLLTGGESGRLPEPVRTHLAAAGITELRIKVVSIDNPCAVWDYDDILL